MTDCLMCEQPIEPGRGHWDRKTLRSWHKRCMWRVRWNRLLAMFLFRDGRWRR